MPASTVISQPAATRSKAAARATDPAMISAQPCPHCEALALARSHSRTFLERVRKVLSSKRIHRCAECGWRGWLFVLIPLEEEETSIQQDEPDFTSIDHSIGTRPMRVAL